MEPKFKVGDLIMEERYPQGGCFVVVAVEKNRFVKPWGEGRFQYKLAFEWGLAWAPPAFIEECIKVIDSS